MGQFRDWLVDGEIGVADGDAQPVEPVDGRVDEPPDGVWIGDVRRDDCDARVRLPPDVVGDRCQPLFATGRQHQVGPIGRQDVALRLTDP